MRYTYSSQTELFFFAQNSPYTSDTIGEKVDRVRHVPYQIDDAHDERAAEHNGIHNETISSGVAVDCQHVGGNNGDSGHDAWVIVDLQCWFAVGEALVSGYQTEVNWTRGLTCS